MHDLKIVRNYARALFSAADDLGIVAELQKNLNDFCAILKANIDLVDALSSPIVQMRIKKNILDQLSEKMKWSELLNKFCIMLCQNNRFDIIEVISSHYHIIHNEQKGIKIADITSAFLMPKKDIAVITKYLEEEMRCSIEVVNSVDAKLIGGFVVNVEDTLLDFSVLGHLLRIEKKAKNINI